MLRKRYNGFAWRHLAKEGVLDAVFVMSVAFDRKDPFGSTERIYRDVMANCGKAKVYFPVSSYNMQNCGIEEYAKLAHISEAENAEERIVTAYAENACVKAGSPSRTVYVVNATGTDSVIVDSPSPRMAEMFNTAGERLETVRIESGVSRVHIPVSGYAKLAPVGTRNSLGTP